MKRFLSIVLMTVFVMVLAGCSNSDSDLEELNDDEQKIVDAIIDISDDFYDPTSIQVYNCSDVFNPTHKSIEKYFIVDGTYYLSPLKGSESTTSEYVMIDISATTKGGGKSKDVYVLFVGEPKEKSNGRYHGTLESLMNSVNKKDLPQDGTTDRSQEVFLGAALWYDLLEEASNYTYDKMATSGSYPVAKGENVDTAKINKALKKHWEDKGLL